MLWEIEKPVKNVYKIVLKNKKNRPAVPRSGTCPGPRGRRRRSWAASTQADPQGEHTRHQGPEHSSLLIMALLRCI